MEDQPKPRRRWLRFSLRTMLVLVTLLCVLCGYLGWAMNWKRQRQEFLTRMDVMQLYMPAEIPATPFPLHFFGEEGVPVLFIGIVKLKPNPETIETAKRLFPEAEIRYSSPGLFRK